MESFWRLFHMHSKTETLSPFAIRAADQLAIAVNRLVENGVLDARSEVADALLSYLEIRFRTNDPIGELKKLAEKIKGEGCDDQE